MVKKYTLPDLPYKYDALEPYISKEIMTLHHDKHHLAYVNGANAALDKLDQGRKNNWQGVDLKAVERDLRLQPRRACSSLRFLAKYEAGRWRQTRRKTRGHDK